jgi:hypothetical protein
LIAYLWHLDHFRLQLACILAIVVLTFNCQFGNYR